MRKLVVFVGRLLCVKLAFDRYSFWIMNISRKGENGEECIKRAICETTKIERTEPNERSKQGPDSFVRELLRVVFR